MLLAVDRVFVNGGMKRLLKGAYGAGDFQRLFTRVHLQYLKAFCLEPALDGLHILVAGPELLTKLLRRQPFMETCCAGSVHVAQQLLQGGFLLRTSLEN